MAIQDRLTGRGILGVSAFKIAAQATIPEAVLNRTDKKSDEMGKTVQLVGWRK